MLVGLQSAIMCMSVPQKTPTEEERVGGEEM